ncbi:hypothetical protein [Hymenobacter negativus]|uniref:Uncharacterized protein n=1 Tax=Hymenobacter negativus TaxID=2795026 RepID=A0ABS3QI05_9BACT|nr:hypothetical protein [Hymenobacter negativus]MBO2010874.1 hypothetical protein [Hymenobacter negativus]
MTDDSSKPANSSKEQTPQNSLTAAIALLGGAVFAGHPVLQGVTVAAAPFLSSGTFGLLKYVAARVKEKRERAAGRLGFDEYLATIEKELKGLPADSPRRAELEADATEVRRARHAEEMKRLTARPQAAQPSEPLRIALTSKPDPPNQE